ncbi:hypothetical protein NOR51B_986 [Luminiphilus syltensis NOR5-1B]|uniref:Uncharacterized protein n=1 Tax=Luminiphilus syltensis NOR5-1B TaxID=565045 RepID=B8KX60_9GAMM|nr:hypothetical protein NOR51B_986 [Luminiphilus syltensis NOR5-1B]
MVAGVGTKKLQRSITLRKIEGVQESRVFTQLSTERQYPMQNSGKTVLMNPSAAGK